MNPARNPAVEVESPHADSMTVQPSLVQTLPSPDRAWRDLLQLAQARYRNCGRFARFFAGGKLGWDPVFRHLLESGHIPAFARVLDIGCGQGLLASLLAAVDDAHRRSRWPAEWPQAPIACRYTGIEMMQRDVDRANHALASLRNHVRVECVNMIEVELPPCDVAVILDVLHYVGQADQQALLAQVLDRLSSKGRLLLRIGDKAASRGFATSQWTDRIITAVRGHRVAPTFCRPLPEWMALLQQIGFVQVRSIPMSRGTPFANVLLVAEKP